MKNPSALYQQDDEIDGIVLNAMKLQVESEKQNKFCDIILFNLVPSFITSEPMKSREIKSAEKRPSNRLSMVATGWTVNDAVFRCKFPWNHTLFSQFRTNLKTVLNIEKEP